jgi:16S rRNA (cytosine967-C5)-methyltransferase
MSPSRRIAYDILIQVQEKKIFLDHLLRTNLNRHRPSAEDRQLLTEIVFGVLRWRNKIDYLLGRFASRPVTEMNPGTRVVLRMGVYQIVFLGGVPDFAAVNEAVLLEKRHGRARSASFVNAVLRALCREKSGLSFPDFSADPEQYLTVTQSHPDWLVRRWADRFGLEDTRRLVEANNRIPPTTLRLNVLKTDGASFEAACTAAGVEVERRRWVSAAYALKKGKMHDTGLFRRGLFFFQDEGAQLAAEALRPGPGEDILDACAAPGGKTAVLAGQSENRARISAVDLNPKRIGRLKENCARLGIGHTAFIQADMQSPPFRDAAFHRILLDAPCSGTGTLRRNPDIRWNRTERDIIDNGRKSKELLEKTAPLLREGGRLVYATCSLEPEEGEEVIGDFLAKHRGYHLEDPRAVFPGLDTGFTTPDGFIRTFPHKHDMDGFFIASLIKR